MFVPDIQCLAWTTDGLAKPLIDARSHLKSIKVCLRDFTKAFRTGRWMDRLTDRPTDKASSARMSLVQKAQFLGVEKKRWTVSELLHMHVD